MADPLSLYDALAGAASIFIGIIAAFLVNSLINKEAEQDKIDNQVRSVNSQLEAIEKRKPEIDDRLEAIFDEDYRSKARQEANNALDRFLKDIVGDEWSPTENPERRGTRWEESVDRFQEFVGDDEWNYHTTEALRNRFTDVLNEAGFAEEKMRIVMRIQRL